MDRNHTFKLLFENCMDLYYTTVVYVHGINGPGNMLHNVSYTWHHMVAKISTKLIGRLYQLRMNSELKCLQELNLVGKLETASVLMSHWSKIYMVSHKCSKVFPLLKSLKCFHST